MRGSHFELNYTFIMAYASRHHAFRKFDETRDSADAMLWMAIEKLMRKIPGWLWRKMGRANLRTGKVNRIRALQQRGAAGLLEPRLVHR